MKQFIALICLFIVAAVAAVAAAQEYVITKYGVSSRMEGKSIYYREYGSLCFG